MSNVYHVHEYGTLKREHKLNMHVQNNYVLSIMLFFCIFKGKKNAANGHKIITFLN